MSNRSVSGKRKKRGAGRPWLMPVSIAVCATLLIVTVVLLIVVLKKDGSDAENSVPAASSVSGGTVPSGGSTVSSEMSSSGSEGKSTESYNPLSVSLYGAPIEVKTVVAHAGYVEDERLFRECLNEKMTAMSMEYHLPLFRFTAKAEIENFKTKFSDFAYDYGWDEVPSFNEATAAYGDDFFAGHSLFMAYVTANSGSYRFALTEVECDSTCFRMNIAQKNFPLGVTEDMRGWFILAEVENKDVANCAEFDAMVSEYIDPLGKVFTDIVSSPAGNTDPRVFLSEHEDLHQILLNDKDATLEYIFSEFLKGQRNGAPQQGTIGMVMWVILDELAPEAQLDFKPEDGQLYFNAWFEQAKKLGSEHDPDWMIANQPAMYKALMMAG